MQQDEEEGSLEESSKADRDTISDQSIDTKYDSWQTLKRIWGTVSPSLDNEIMWKCLYFCYLFPKAYNFYKEDIIHIWLAQGFFPVSEMMEYCISLYFNEFEKLQIFLLSGLDCSTRRLRYRLNNSIVNLLVECHSDEYSRVDDSVSYVSRNTLHYSCGDSSIDPITLQDLYRAKKLSTLLILHQSGSCFGKIPRELFLNLPFLRVLDLSYTHIVALPSSIAKLKDLRYLNLSGTPMTMLPSSMCTLCKLQVLKLRGCLKLVSLPRDLRKLKSLRHLDLDLSCLLVSMPSGIGNLTELRSLPAFVVGKHDGFHINELKFMNNLGGTLRIMRLENVANLEEAKEASLDQKLNVRKIELHWTEVIDGNELLENLKPHKSVSELQITGYGGVKFPCWIGQPLFSQLLSITIHDCKKCELLPPLGKLPLLSDLYISDMHEVKDIDQRLCSRNSNIESLDNDKSCDANMFKAFPSLVKFTLSGMPKLEKWSGIEEGDFPRLKKLSISDCGILIALPKLSLLKSLRQLEISLCPSLSNFPTEGLPGSLGVIVIIDCPLLKEWCHKDGVQASGMLERIPNVWIDHHQILRVSPSPTTGDSPLPSQNFEPNVQELSDTDTDKGNRVGVDSLIMIELHESPEKTLESPLPTAGNSHLPSDDFGPNVRVLSDTDMEKGKREGVDSLIMIEPHGSPEKILASPSPTTGDSPSPSKKFEHNIQVLSSTDMEKRNSEDVGSLIMIESHWSPEKRLASPPTTGNSPLPSQNIEPNVRELLGANMKEGNRAGVDSLIIIEPHGSPEKRLEEVASELSSPQKSEDSDTKFLTQSGTFQDGDLLVNKYGFRIVPSSEEEVPPAIKPMDGHLNLKDLEVIKVLQKGSGGIVQLVLHSWTNQFLAHKAIQVYFEENTVEQIAQELKHNQSGQCPYVAVCYQSFYDNGVLSLILEYMDGGSLADFLKKVNSIPEQYLAAICKQVLKGFLYLHQEKHIIHRDMKPSNVLINHRGEVKITDFGVNAALATASAERTTIYYLSPERISGSKYSYSYESDIWSLGIVLLECATGRFPYHVPKEREQWYGYFKFMDAVVNGPPPYAVPDQFSPEFCSFISACLKKDPIQRQTAQQLMKHPFISMYDDLNVDLAAYFTNVGSLLAIIDVNDKKVVKRRRRRRRNRTIEMDRR